MTKELVRQVISSVVIILTVFCTYVQAKNSAYVGQWDSSIYNLIDHPKTVCLRIEVLDSETRLPIENATVSLKGVYMIEGRTSRHPEGEQRAQEKEYELIAHTNKEGIAIAALTWGKEYPWQNGIDEIEKVQLIEIVRSGYHFIENDIPFKRFLEIGQNKNSTSQEPKYFDLFEKAWAKECARKDVKFCTPRFDKDFKDFKNKKSKLPDLFEKILNKEWGIIYEAPINLMKWEDQDKVLCGPYLIYNIKIYMERLKNNNQSLELSLRERNNSISKSSDIGEASSIESSASGGIKSWNEAKEIIERNLSKENRAIFSIDNNKYETELYWQIKRGTWTHYQVKIPKNTEYDGYSMKFSYSGNAVKISHQNPEPSEIIKATPTNSEGQMLDDQYPTSVNLYAASTDSAKEIVRALIYLASIDSN